MKGWGELLIHHGDARPWACDVRRLRDRGLPPFPGGGAKGERRARFALAAAGERAAPLPGEGVPGPVDAGQG